MTPIYQVYNAFLSKMLDDEWTGWEAEDIERDWRSILDSALPYFRFPRKSLEIEEDNFVDDLDNEEIQILATFELLVSILIGVSIFFSSTYFKIGKSLSNCSSTSTGSE